MNTGIRKCWGEGKERRVHLSPTGNSKENNLWGFMYYLKIADLCKQI